ncbi:ribokinase [Chakrabartyella piscis]|uniref:ribokinase n=1 Tax=Chakrabartyella piscis TaxID=2918914 RepID=UPI002958567C|nr:ribokinase [Chakrabartyella piscis]
MKILNFGSMNIDYVYQVDHFVSAGETLSSSELFINSGGKGLNQSIAAAKAGNIVYHAGYLGKEGTFLKDKLAENQVDVSNISFVESSCGHAIIQVDGAGQNCILLYGGTNQILTKEYINSVLDVFGNEGLVLLQNETNLVGYIIEEAHKRGLLVVLNAAPMDAKVLEYPLDLLDWLFVNEVEGAQIAGCAIEEEIIGVLQEKYPNVNVLLTLGSRGAICATNGKRYQIPCHKVSVVDTTAAGDTFCGYFTYGVLHDMEISEALQLATTASALAIGKKGASDSVPSKEEVDAVMANQELPILEVKILD